MSGLSARWLAVAVLAVAVGFGGAFGIARALRGTPASHAAVAGAGPVGIAAPRDVTVARAPAVRTLPALAARTIARHTTTEVTVPSTAGTTPTTSSTSSTSPTVHPTAPTVTTTHHSTSSSGGGTVVQQHH